MIALGQYRGGVLPQRDPRDKTKKVISMYLPTWIVDELGKLADAGGHSRNEYMIDVLRSHVQASAHDETPEKKKPAKR